MRREVQVNEAPTDTMVRMTGLVASIVVALLATAYLVAVAGGMISAGLAFPPAPWVQGVGGVTSLSLGVVLVILIMIVYYRLSGVLAVSALGLYVVLTLAGLSVFGFTLTLPGLAGLVLSVGIAVDANVLIFERIREELRNQKTVRQSVQLGYNRAFRTILDSNLTTLFSALFLYGFGTGPIKGFAVTLSIGLIANMFTAVLFTRMIFDFMLDRGPVERLSI